MAEKHSETERWLRRQIGVRSEPPIRTQCSEDLLGLTGISAD